MSKRERLIRIQYYDESIKLIDSVVLPFKGFQWIDTTIKVDGAQVQPHSIKVTIFESEEAE